MTMALSLSDSQELHLERPHTLGELEDLGCITLGRGKVISKITMQANPGSYPVYSSSAQGDGQIGSYGAYMFDDERLTWSVDGGGRFFYRPPQKYSVTNVAGWLKVNTYNINCRYLYFLLTSKWLGLKYDYIHKAHPSVIRNEYVGLKFPPLAEQKRIVAKIDAAFEKIDALKANAEKNLANAKELFQSALDEAMRPKKGWVEKRLGEVAEIQRGGSPRPIKDFITQSKDGYNWIKIGDVDPSGKFITSTAEKIRKEGLRKTRQVFAGEFLLSNSMSFGRPYILKIDGCIHDGWLVLRGFQKLYKEDFFYHLLRSKWIQNQFNSLAYGSTVRNLNSNSVSKVIVPIVALEEQQEIADSLDRLQSQAGVLQQNYARQIADCAEMRQAILREAFEGRL